jgi:hypothetical protein
MHCGLVTGCPESIHFFHADLATNERTKGFRVADFTRSRTLACRDFRCAKDRLVLVSPSRGKILNIFRIGTVDREDGFSNPGGPGFVDHVQRINRAFLVACGLLTRLAAASLALGMAGALYTSVRLGEDWLRAALYLIIFVALTLTGPGKFSLDHLLKRKKSPATKG